jgi:hypothetical protein
MAWKTEISLRNNSESDIICVIPKGQVFENKRIGTKIQSVASSREYRLVIPAGSRIRAEIDVYCMNRSLSEPQGDLGNVTVFRIDEDFENQEQLWDLLSRPRA